MPAVKGNLDDKNNAPTERHPKDDEPFSALAFKIMTDPFVGKLIFFRVYSGVLNSGDTVYNPIKSRKERIGRLMQMHANKREEIKEVYAGDIAAVVGLKDVTTGDTLCDEDNVIILEPMTFPEPVISHGRRAEDQGRPGEDGHGAAAAGGGRPDLPRAHRRGNRPDHHRRHGRAAPRNHRRPHEARVQGGSQRRQAAVAYRETIRASGRGRRQVHTPVRRPRPVRPRVAQDRAAGTGQGLSSS